MESYRMREVVCVVLISLCLPGVLGQNYGVSSYQPQYPAPSYNPQPQYYSKPQYYETLDTQVDYKEANQTRQCGILPVVHHPYGYEKDRVSFGEFPWQAAIMDTYYNYKCAAGIISPRHVITSSYCVDQMNEDQIRVRVGEWDLQSDKNYQEVYKNYEISVCKKHPFYYVPQYVESYNGPAPQASYDYQASYPVTILELSEDIDFDQYPQVEPVCVPEFYYLSKSYTNEYSPPAYSYGGYGGAQGGGAQGAGQSQGQQSSAQQKNEEGADKDLECFVVGYQESPVEKIEFQSSTPFKPASYAYGENYSPSYSYESYEYSRTPRMAKVQKISGSKPYQQSYGYTPESDSWEAEYYYDACHADLGSPIFCLVEPPYEGEDYYPAYPISYPETYAPAYSPPAYSPPAYSPPAYSSPAYSPPAYSPPAYSPPAYSPPSYQQQRYRRQASYYPSPSYAAPSYAPPSYAPAYEPSYAPSYNPTPYYEEYYPKYPIKVAEPLNRESRRAVLYGVVQFPTQCSNAYGSEGNKINATPAKDLVAWIMNVLKTPATQCGYQQSYTPAYSPPAYSPPAYSPPAYSPPAYSPPAYSPPAYSPPAYSPPAYSPPAYSPPAYSPPAYSPPAYSPPAYSPPAYSAPAYSPPAYSPPAMVPPSYTPSYTPSYGY